MNAFDKRPVLMQGSDSPIIINEFETGINLICESCNKSILVENYSPECLVGIGLQCLRCGHVTWTPSMPTGEVFPSTQVVTLGDKGTFLIGSSVRNKKGVVLTCDQELVSVAVRTTPNKIDNENLELSMISLEKTSVELDLLSGGNFNRFLRAAKKAVERGHKYYRTNPLAWAMEYIKYQLSKNSLNINDESTLVAIALIPLIQGYTNIIRRWRNHDHITHIAQEFCASFNHTLAQFIAASYLSEHGNRVAVNPPNSSTAGRSADLYIRVSAIKKLFMEIKTPQAFEWPNRTISRKNMKKVVETCLSNARGQINRKKPGILILGTTCLLPGFLKELGEIIKTVLSSKGRNYSSFAGIGYVGLDELLLRNTGFSMNFSISYYISIEKNLHYFQENPIRP